MGEVCFDIVFAVDELRSKAEGEGRAVEYDSHTGR